MTGVALGPEQAGDNDGQHHRIDQPVRESHLRVPGPFPGLAEPRPRKIRIFFRGGVPTRASDIAMAWLVVSPCPNELSRKPLRHDVNGKYSLHFR